MTKKLITLIAAMTILLAALPVAAGAATSGTSTGSFQAKGKAPTINSISLSRGDGGMTPQVEYYVSVGVTDNNKLSDLTSLEVTVFHSTSTVAMNSGAASGQKDVVLTGGGGVSFSAGQTVIIADGSSSETNVIDTISTDTLTMKNDLTNTYSAPATVRAVPTGGNTQTASILTWTASTGNFTIDGTSGGGSWDNGPATGAGTIDTSTSSATVTGTDTSFDTDIAVGGVLKTTGDVVIGTVSSVDSATQVTLTGNAASTNSGIAYHYDNNVVPTLTTKTGTFRFHFHPGKVATEATSGEWYITAKATDASSLVGGLSTTARTMAFYSEITVNTGSVNFSLVDPNSGFADGTNEVDNISVTYLANGDYAEKISATNWYDSSADDTLNSSASSGQKDVVVVSASGFEAGMTVFIQDDDNTALYETNTIASTSGTTFTMTTNLANTYSAGATIKHVAIFTGTTSTTSANEFALLAYPSDTFGSAVTVDTSGVQLTTGTQTSESGNVEGTNALWLKLAETFDSATYSGTITYAIVNN